jgi:hypothetical protein
MLGQPQESVIVDCRMHAAMIHGVGVGQLPPFVWVIVTQVSVPVGADDVGDAVAMLVITACTLARMAERATTIANEAKCILNRNLGLIKMSVFCVVKVNGKGLTYPSFSPKGLAYPSYPKIMTNIPPVKLKAIPTTLATDTELYLRSSCNKQLYSIFSLDFYCRCASTLPVWLSC